MKTVSNKVKVLDDGRVEITLLMPLPLFRYKKWVKFYTHGSELVIEGDKIMGVRCNPKVWEETLKRLASNRPELLEGFRKTVEKGIIHLVEKGKHHINFWDICAFSIAFTCMHEILYPDNISVCLSNSPVPCNTLPHVRRTP